jgi:DNA repair protein RecN (Recombination protein N)
MLTALHIENFALIDALDLAFQSGLNVLTGETGAGKSIILDALDAVLGGKANQRLVRSGTDRAIVEAVFEISTGIRNWLTDHDVVVDGNQLVCRREFTLSKTSVRSRSYLNGQQINKTHMEDLRQLLVEITAQGQTVQVGSPDLQRQWLDEFGGEAVLRQRQQVSQAFEAATQAKRKLDNRRRAEQERLEKLDLLQLYQTELQQSNLEDP